MSGILPPDTKRNEVTKSVFSAFILRPIAHLGGKDQGPQFVTHQLAIPYLQRLKI